MKGQAFTWSRARRAFSLAAALLLATPLRGADLDALERAVRDACDQRARLVDERARRMGEAAVLADEIARRKGDAPRPARADRGLEDALKRFDRVARHLDAVDRRISGQDRTIATLKQKFHDAANAAASRLSGGSKSRPIGQVARDLDAIDRTRNRVAGLGASDPAFRPVLDVTVSPDDGAIEIRHKLLLLESERDRVLAAIAQLDADDNVLAARIAVKRRLSAELETAARTAGSELALLRRESENVAERLHDLDGQREELARQKADLQAARAQVERRLEELGAALRQPGVSKGDPR